MKMEELFTGTIRVTLDNGLAVEFKEGKASIVVDGFYVCSVDMGQRHMEVLNWWCDWVGLETVNRINSSGTHNRHVKVENPSKGED